ncbi:hypothetical protein BDV95DRAFT_609474 [Massariosphaeria phaeospora]|uniref:Aminoglycoside phosphotransferase domain-containing protein n=1 Tax=Massariosphaeria phaeospora TaxID=100035 RepID=A0A7C8I1R5_9PLEO|nr:hypothetical protein BDV95DRAFT_609474 [Massariosphaeria phaeospora]
MSISSYRGKTPMVGNTQSVSTQSTLSENFQSAWFTDWTAGASKWVTANSVSDETEQKRITFLRSLARNMVALSSLSFEKMGTPIFDALGPDHMPEIQLRKVADLIYSSPHLGSYANTDLDKSESFVLRHPDLDLQNNLVDDEGNVTGIIDWDGCTTVPRCEVETYRKFYTDAIIEAGCPTHEAKYTRKSAMYRAIILAIGNNHILDIVNKVLLELPGTRHTNLQEYLQCLGRGWIDAKEYLKLEIDSLVAPEKPLITVKEREVQCPDKP